MKNASTIVTSPVVRTLVYANIFISLCAFSQVLLTYHLFPVPFNFDNNTYLLFVFLATYLQYNLQRGYSVAQLNLYTDRSVWLAKYRKPMLISALIALIVLLFLCNGLSWTSIFIMAGAEVVSNLYYLPPFNLRRYGYIKPFLIASVWVISCCLVPLIENRLYTPHSLWFMASQFLFIGVLSMLFDIKDADDDYVNGVNTYANIFGIKPTKILCIVLTVVSCICFYQFMPGNASVIRISILGLLTIAAVLLTNDRKHAFYYYLSVDGLLIVQTLLFFCDFL